MTASQRSYLTSIYRLKKEKDRVLSVDVANDLDVSRTSVSKAMKTLARLECIFPSYPDEVRLTDQGETNARRILKEEQVVADFLQTTLDISSHAAGRCAADIAHLLNADILQQMQALCPAHR